MHTFHWHHLAHNFFPFTYSDMWLLGPYPHCSHTCGINFDPFQLQEFSPCSTERSISLFTLHLSLVFSQFEYVSWWIQNTVDVTLPHLLDALHLALYRLLLSKSNCVILLLTSEADLPCLMPRPLHLPLVHGTSMRLVVFNSRVMITTLFSALLLLQISLNSISGTITLILDSICSSYYRHLLSASLLPIVKSYSAGILKLFCCCQILTVQVQRADHLHIACSPFPPNRVIGAAMLAICCP